MSTTVFLAVVMAALLHAVWNALVKGGADKHMGMAAVSLGHAPFAIAVLPFAPVVDMAALPWILASIMLHLGYQLFLLAAYKIGDLTQVYPMARGSAPLIVTAYSVFVLGVVLDQLQLLAVLLIAAGIISLALVRKRDGLRNRKAAVLALGTGAFIAAYSLVDGLGARAAGSPLGFYAYVGLGSGALFGLVTMVMRPDVLPRLLTDGRKMFFIGGGCSFAAYSLVVWAFTHAPIALVTALRETSIVFALMIGVFALGERLDLGKVVSTATTLMGAVLLRAAKS